RAIFDLRNVEHGQLKRHAHLLGGEADAIGGMHRFQHVGHQRANPLVHLLDPFSLRAQNRVSVFYDRQFHFSPCVKAGRFFTPASFNASITLMIVPNEAFLSACKASADLRVGGKFRTDVSSSSALTTWPSSRISSVS